MIKYLFFILISVSFIMSCNLRDDLYDIEVNEGSWDIDLDGNNDISLYTGGQSAGVYVSHNAFEPISDNVEILFRKEDYVFYEQITSIQKTDTVMPYLRTDIYELTTCDFVEGENVEEKLRAQIFWSETPVDDMEESGEWRSKTVSMQYEVRLASDPIDDIWASNVDEFTQTHYEFKLDCYSIQPGQEGYLYFRVIQPDATYYCRVLMKNNEDGLRSFEEGIVWKK